MTIKKEVEMKYYNWEFKRGWNACDICGKFTSPSAQGVSRYFVPDSEYTSEDTGLRCAKCTEKYGQVPPSQGCVQKYCSTTNR